MMLRIDPEDHDANLPDRVTVRQQLAYHSAAAGAVGEQMIERFWDGARTIITDWKCDALPDIGADLDAVEDPRAASVIMWAGIETWNYIKALESVPKN